MREDFPDGTARLWGPGTLIGDWTGARASAKTRVTVLTETSAGLQLTASDIAQIAATHGQVIYALGRIGMHRLHAAETVYGASRLSPLVRVAKLLSFLSYYTGYYDTRRRDGQRVVGIARDGLVEGPGAGGFRRCPRAQPSVSGESHPPLCATEGYCASRIPGNTAPTGDT
ncbi:hypothetical protein [Streptomyces sp. NPDC005096]|uniref:hypothetical protein n=1 Tax=Streptomyces sp. NPDC005096 TaxID=3154559 RepID=UPI0033B7DCFF